MSYFKTSHQKNSAKITSLIVVILVLLLFVVGPPYMDPPLEYGVAVNFGTTDYGSGNQVKKTPPKAEPKEKVEEVKPETPKQETSPVSQKTEDLITKESEESIAIKKQKEAEEKAKAEAERIEREKQEAEAEKKRIEEEKKRKLDNLIGGVKNSKEANNGGEGPDNKAGNKGQLNGNPYAPSYFGDKGPGKGGVGYGLNGRGTPDHGMFKPDCNEYGLVVVQIRVNRQGNVIEAVPGIKGTTNKHKCLMEPAKKIAFSYKWEADSNAPSEQVGFVSINFDIGQ